MLTEFFIAEKNHEKIRETILVFHMTRFFSREKDPHLLVIIGTNIKTKLIFQSSTCPTI